MVLFAPMMCATDYQWYKTMDPLGSQPGYSSLHLIEIWSLKSRMLLATIPKVWSVAFWLIFDIFLCAYTCKYPLSACRLPTIIVIFSDKLLKMLGFWPYLLSHLPHWFICPHAISTYFFSFSDILKRPSVHFLTSFFQNNSNFSWHSNGQKWLLLNIRVVISSPATSLPSSCLILLESSSKHVLHKRELYFGNSCPVFFLRHSILISRPFLSPQALSWCHAVGSLNASAMHLRVPDLALLKPSPLCLQNRGWVCKCSSADTCKSLSTITCGTQIQQILWWSLSFHSLGFLIIRV